MRRPSTRERWKLGASCLLFGLLFGLACGGVTARIPALAWPAGRILCPGGSLPELYRVAHPELEGLPGVDPEALWSVRCRGAGSGRVVHVPAEPTVTLLFLALWSALGIGLSAVIGLVVWPRIARR